MRNERRIGWVLAALGMLLVSTDSLFIRLADADDWTVAFLVSVFALPTHLLLNRYVGTQSPVAAVRAYPGPLILVATNAAISQLAFIAAVNRTSVANVVVVIGSAPILAALAGRVILGERADRRTWIAITVVMAGILIVVSGSLGSASLTGDLLALVAIAAFSVNFTIWRRYPDLNRFIGLALSAVITMVVAAPFADPLSQPGSVLLPLAAMGLVFNPLGRLCHTNAPRFAPAAEVALFVPVETVAATAWAWIAFTEVPTDRTVVGGLLIIAAVLWGTFGRLLQRERA